MRRALLILSLALSACHQEYRLGVTTHGTPSSETTTRPGAPAAVAIITNLQGPESVLYDPQQDVYFISNLNGGLLTIDGNGFISRVDAKTLKVDLKWVQGLDAPKGMAIAGNTLYVSDITAIRKFDRRTGAPLGEVRVPGATLINDLTSDGKHVWATDTGVSLAAGEKFLRTNTEAVWEVGTDKAVKVAGGLNLKEPNGIDYAGGKLWVVSFGSNEMYRIDSGKKSDVIEVPKGQLDGIVHLRDGSVLVSSWQGHAVYRGRGKEFYAVLEGIGAPADIGYDSKRNRFMVPRSTDNEVTIHNVD